MTVRTGKPVGRPREPGTRASVHMRLSRERGPARAHACVDCGKQAAEWAFDERTGFSEDLTRYSPLCHSCHKWRDKPCLGVSHAHQARNAQGRFA